MKILVTGKGSSGSWAIRGKQLGQAIGADVRAMATDARGYDLAVVVKRTPPEVMQAIRKADIPWVLDVVDMYPQPACVGWTLKEGVSWVRKRIADLAPSAVIWPCKRMMDDCAMDLPQKVLYHHHRPEIRENPIWEKVSRIGYEGDARYLEGWRPKIEQECDRRGWTFVINPNELRDIDIVLAVRGDKWNGELIPRWKSNVKLANAHGSGTPFVGQEEAGYLETASGVEYWANDPASLRRSLDWLVSQDTREVVRDRFLQKAYSLESAATDLKAFLYGL